MSKEITTLNIEAEIKEAMMKKYPRQLSQITENHWGSLIAPSEADVKQKDSLLLKEQVLTKERNAIDDELTSIKIKLNKIDEKIQEELIKRKEEEADNAKEQEERYPTCLICHAQKENTQFVKTTPGKEICKSCYMDRTNTNKIGKILNIQKRRLGLHEKEPGATDGSGETEKA